MYTYVLIHKHAPTCMYIPAIVIKTAFLTGVSPKPIKSLQTSLFCVTNILIT